MRGTGFCPTLADKHGAPRKTGHGQAEEKKKGTGQPLWGPRICRSVSCIDRLADAAIEKAGEEGTARGRGRGGGGGGRAANREGASRHTDTAERERVLTA